MGLWHLHGINETGMARVECACDVNQDALSGFAEKSAVPELCADYREILEDPSIDAVILSLPHHLHEKVTCEAFALGKHVLVDKPIARTCVEARRMIDAGKKAGKVLMVVHNQRFEPAVQQLKAAVARGDTGRIMTARADHHQNLSHPAGSWWYEKDKVGGGAVIGSGIHRLDLLRWIVGEVKEVFAYTLDGTGLLKAEIAAVVCLKFCSGAIGDFFIHWGLPSAPCYESLSIHGTTGALYLTDQKLVFSPHPGKGNDSLPVTDSNLPQESLWLHFIRCIENGIEPLTSGTEAMKSLALVEAIIQSANEKRPVALPENE